MWWLALVAPGPWEQRAGLFPGHLQLVHFFEAHEFSTLIGLDGVTGLLLESGVETRPLYCMDIRWGLETKIWVLFPGNEWVSTIEIFLFLFSRRGNWCSGKISSLSRSHCKEETGWGLDPRTSNSASCTLSTSRISDCDGRCPTGHSGKHCTEGQAFSTQFCP